MQFLRVPRAFLMFIVLLIAVGMIPATLYGMGVIAYRTAWATSNFGMALVVLGTFAYIAFYDSRKRWPGVPLLRRLGRLLPF